MDPLSMIAMASTTFKGIKTLVDRGAEIEHVAQKLGAWYGYAADIKQIEKEAESPGIFKKQIRELIVWAYGVETYQEMIMLRRKIKAQREQAIYKQRRRRRMFVDGIFLLIGLGVGAGIIYGTVALIRGAS